MRKDQIFVLLLIVVLPLSGCMDGAVGGADAQDSTSDEGTTIVNNNYYNNTTTIIQSTSQLSHEFDNGSISIATGPNEVIEIVSLDAVRPIITGGPPFSTYQYDEQWISTWSPSIDVNCTMFEDSIPLNLGATGYSQSGTTTDILPSDGGVCTYSITNEWDYGQATAYENLPNVTWPLSGMMSITYIIHSTI